MIVWVIPCTMKSDQSLSLSYDCKPYILAYTVLFLNCNFSSVTCVGFYCRFSRDSREYDVIENANVICGRKTEK